MLIFFDDQFFRKSATTRKPSPRAWTWSQKTWEKWRYACLSRTWGKRWQWPRRREMWHVFCPLTKSTKPPGCCLARTQALEPFVPGYGVLWTTPVMMIQILGLLFPRQPWWFSRTNSELSWKCLTDLGKHDTKLGMKQQTKHMNFVQQWAWRGDQKRLGQGPRAARVQRAYGGIHLEKVEWSPHTQQKPCSPSQKKDLEKLHDWQPQKHARHFLHVRRQRVPVLRTLHWAPPSN